MNELEIILRNTYNQWGKETVIAIQKKIDSYKLNYTGTLKKSVQFIPGADLSNLGQVIIAPPADKYADFMDQGVSGTEIKRNSPYKFKGTPKTIGGMAFYLKPWATSKGLNPWAVAHSMAKKGIKARPFFKSVIEARTPMLGEMWADAEKEYLESMVAKFNASKQ